MILLLCINNKFAYYLPAVASFIEMIDLISISPFGSGNEAVSELTRLTGSNGTHNSDLTHDWRIECISDSDGIEGKVSQNNFTN